MSALTAAMDTALAADRVILFGAVQIDLPSYTLRLLDGMSELTFNGGTFVGSRQHLRHARRDRRA
jgi:hypothetical protein